MAALKPPTAQKRPRRTESESNTIPALKFIPGMDPTLVDEPPEGAGWLHEIKYDGYRTHLIRDVNGIRALTRRGLDWTDKYRLIVDDAAAIDATSFIIDGEICVQDETGRTDFGAVRRAMTREPHRLVYFVFDLLHLDGEDLRSKPLEERRAKLRWLVQHLPGHIKMSDEFDGDGAKFFELADHLGLEGIVSKRKGSRYSSGDTRAWLKAKCWRTDVFDVIGVEKDPRGVPYALLADQDGYKGAAFVTLPAALRDAFWRYIEAQGVPTAPIRGVGKKKATWVRPGLRATVRHLKGEEKLRHATVQDIILDD